MEKSVLIVGAGMAGLSAGCYAQRNGFRTTIFEMHSLPGGLCAAWKRKGYTFDISMHMLTGSVSGPFHQMWEELGVMNNRVFHYHENASRIEGRGKRLDYFTDRVRLEEQMLALSPADAGFTREFIKLVFGPDMMKAASLQPVRLQTIGDKLRMMMAILPLMKVFGKYRTMTIQEFASRFQDPFLREAVRFFVDAPGWPMPRFPMVALAGFMRSAVTEAGTPLGGSHQVANDLAGTFTRRGGEIHYRKRVSDLIIDKERAVGLCLEDGSEHRADHIIWAADGHTLIYNILGGKYMNDRIRKIYDSWIPVRPVLHVMLGVNRDLSAEPHRLVMELEQPITIGKEEHRWMSVIHHCFDPSAAPEGKSAVEVWYDTDYDYWEDLAKDHSRYEAEKQRIASFSIAALDRRWPGFASQVEVVDVPTPATYVRYTGNWKASPDGWYITDANMRDQEPLRILPGLEGLLMAGQWTAPFTGTVIAALTGRQVVQLICEKEKIKFRAT